MVVGDSAWSVIVNLTEAQAATYFADRKADGFDSVLISLFSGSMTGPGFGRSNFSTPDGIVPFTTPGNISTPNPAYFQRVDDMINHRDRVPATGVMTTVSASLLPGLPLMRRIVETKPECAVGGHNVQTDALQRSRMT